MYTPFHLYELVQHDLWSYDGPQEIGIVLKIDESYTYGIRYSVFWMTSKILSTNENYNTLIPATSSKG